jgi:hypothetical protein
MSAMGGELAVLGGPGAQVVLRLTAMDSNAAVDPAPPAVAGEAPARV